MNKQKVSITKPIISVKELCEILQMSRSRYYQLVESGYFPKPLIDERSSRPYFDAALQKQILEARQTGIGIDGSYMLFYSPRKKEKTRSFLKQKKQADPVSQELTDILNSMGVEAAFTEVQKALNELYPDGTEGVDQGVVTRELYRYFKKK
jgi:hypothetical protein